MGIVLDYLGGTKVITRLIKRWKKQVQEAEKGA